MQKLTKSIRDFGFGKRSWFEGGVGLFVFSGIGELNVADRYRAGRQLCWCTKFNPIRQHMEKSWMEPVLQALL